MNNQYSRGCGYNYRRSPQRDIAMERRSMENRRMENNCAENRYPGECSMANQRMEKCSMEKSLAMGYVPMQMWSQPLPLDKSLRIGTIFADLHKPFCGKGGVCR